MNMQHNVQVFKFIHSNLYFLVCCFSFFSLSLSLFKMKSKDGMKDFYRSYLWWPFTQPTSARFQPCCISLEEAACTQCSQMLFEKLPFRKKQNITNIPRSRNLLPLTTPNPTINNLHRLPFIQRPICFVMCAGFRSYPARSDTHHV